MKGVMEGLWLLLMGGKLVGVKVWGGIRVRIGFGWGFAVWGWGENAVGCSVMWTDDIKVGGLGEADVVSDK
ncbi:hypothetical protein, partial [Bacillus velezensis]|uniref:hypothetical protein n=1 Tax=Bacillus velezensis TaxID=492670 RepID=UPI001C930952